MSCNRKATEPGSAASLGNFSSSTLEDVRARLQRLTEALLLAHDDVAHERRVPHQVGVGLAHDLDGGVDELGGDEVLDVEPVGVANRASDETPQHVAPTLVRREDTVADEEADRARVIGHDPQAHVRRLVGAVTSAGELLRHVDQRGEHVGLEHRVHVLQQHQVALEARTGVDVLPGQVGQRRRRAAG